MKVSDVKLREVSEGIVQGVDTAICPANSVFLSSNLWFHKTLGRAVLREGISQLGDTKTGTCQGLYQFVKASGVTKALAVFDNDILYLASGNWTQGADVTTGSTVRFLTYLDNVLALDGTAALSSDDGISWIATGGVFDLANIPQGKYGLEWQDKIYIAGVTGEPDRLYYSSLPITGAISWTDETAEYIDIEPEDGAGPIVGLAKVPGYILIFKERSLKRWNGYSTYPDDLMSIGTQSQESIVFARQTVFFWNERGVFETNGGYPRKVSRRIQEIVDAVNSSYPVSGWSDKENVYFSIGDITLDGITLKNCVVAYNLDSQTWSLHSFPQDFRRWSGYVSSGEHIIAGDTTGKVFQVFTGTTDGTADISWLLQYQNQEIGHRTRYKDISRFAVLTKNMNNGTLYVRAENSDFQPAGTFNEDVAIIHSDHRGRYFDFRLIGSGRGGEIISLEIPESAISISQEQ